MRRTIFKERLKSLVYAYRGFLSLIKTEDSIKFQFIIALMSIVAGFYFNITKAEWLVQILVIGFVFGLEAVNTAIEEISDFVHPEFHKKIGKVKDLAAGAVLIAGITAIVIAAVIYIPYFTN